MSNKGANGSTFAFASTTTTAIHSISFKEDGNEVDLTTLDSAYHKFVAGIPSIECSIDVIGNVTNTIGQTGAIAIAWFDGTSDSMTTALITSLETSGELDGEIKTSITFKPYAG